MSVKWVGSPGVHVPLEEQEKFEELLAEYGCVPVFLQPDLQERFFNGFCKEVLWPLLHYVMPQVNQNFGKRWDAAWQAYTAANQIYANVVTQLVESSNDFIWVQNYHLLIVPSFLRKKLPRAKIGIFIHTPFPSSDVFRVLPARENILRGIMSADLVGFHTFDYARHFLSCCKRVLDLDFETMPGGTLGVKYSGRFVSLLISHVGIESEELSRLAHTTEVLQRAEAIRKKYHPRKIIIGVDDLDLVKGSLLKLQAFERFLRTHPDWKDKVVLLQVILPWSMSNATKALVRDAVVAEVAQIRSEFGEKVIEVIERESIDLNEQVALHVASHAAVISTFWDGLNLAPYEFTASQNSDDPGALVLSEFMGCSRSLSGVLRVNPWSLEQVSDAIHTALSMTKEERIANHQRRYHYVMTHTLERWAVGFLRNLHQATKLVDHLNFVQVGWGSNVRLVGLRSDFTHLDHAVVTRAYQASAQRVLLLDYDGTLTPAQPQSTESSHVAPSDELKRVLRKLASNPKNTVFLLTGRKRDILAQWFGDIPELGLAAEKGVFIKWPLCLRRKPAELVSGESKDAGEVKQAVEPAPDLWEVSCPIEDFTWKEIALEVIKAYTEQTDGSWIEDKEYGIVWHYEAADPEYGRMQASELSKYLNKVISTPGIDVVKYDYNRILEVKPHGVNKGTTANLILDAVLGHSSAGAAPSTASSSSSASASAALQNPPFLLCVGDDKSDEDMFKAIQAHSVRFHKAGEHEDKNEKGKKERRTGAFTCCVGIKPSNARFYLHDDEEVHSLLQALAACKQVQSLSAAGEEEDEEPSDHEAAWSRAKGGLGALTGASSSLLRRRKDSRTSVDSDASSDEESDVKQRSPRHKAL